MSIIVDQPFLLRI
jgi:hypothetical protein